VRATMPLLIPTVANVLFILGAGASAEGGCPCMPGFFDRAQDLYWAGTLDEREAAAFLDVQNMRAHLQGAHSKAQIDIHNLEGVFNALEMGAFLARENSEDEARFARARTSLFHVITATLERTQTFPWHAVRRPATDALFYSCSGPKGYAEFAAALRQRSEKRPDLRFDFITFNYDIGLEFAPSAFQLPYSYGLPGAQGLAAASRVLKLHGSLNWFRVPGASQISVLDVLPRHMEPDQMDATLNEGRLLLSRSIPTGKEPVIVPPSERKATERALLQGIWQEGATVLSTADVIVAIGFSVPPTDTFFREFFALGSMGPAVLRHFYVYDPDSAVEERYRNLLSGHAATRFQFRPLQFVQAAFEIRDQVILF
jgi:hypothetical protein